MGWVSPIVIGRDGNQKHTIYRYLYEDTALGNLAQGQLNILLRGRGRGVQKPSFIKNLICINSRWPSNDLPILSHTPHTNKRNCFGDTLLIDKSHDGHLGFMRMRPFLSLYT